MEQNGCERGSHAMKPSTASKLRAAARVLRFGAIAAAGLGLVAFAFALIAHGFDLNAGLDWARKITLILGALMLITGGCGLLVSGRDRPDAQMTPHEDDTFRMFWHEIGMPWGAAVSIAAVSFIVVGSLVDLVYLVLA